MKKRLHTQEQIDAMRKRLYARNRDPSTEQPVRHKLSDTKVAVLQNWDTNVNSNPTRNTTDLRAGMSVTAGEETQPATKRKRPYRRFVLVGSLLIFIFLAGVSTLYLYFGGNQISNDNIQIAVQGPNAVGGGETLPLQVAVTNQNKVPIESVTLIVKYPVGTRSVGDTPRNLFEERIPLEDLAPGEVQNVPIRVTVFGEEAAQKSVSATIEYRVSGSNGMFYKDADPHAFQINSSPLVLRVDSLEKVASGQLVSIELTAVSNASAPLEDILITASYPNGFSYESSSPEPVFGQNVWRIDSLEPEGSETIVIEGTMNGLTEETLRMNFSAGPANPDNPYLVGATLADAGIDFSIERPFIDVAVHIGGESGREVVLSEGQAAEVSIDITNTLDETVYDMVVEVIPGGNILTEESIRSRSGFYDSNIGSVRWEVANNPSFDQILPGGSRSLSFSVVPGEARSTASFDLEVNVYARRVAESSAQETLLGTELAEAKYSSSVTLGSQAGRNVGRFGDSGPLPPTVGEETTYTLTMVAEAGLNDMTDTVVKTSLPVYVNWLDAYDVEGSLQYNSVSKDIEWTIGDIPAGERKELTFQVSIQPSVSQVGAVPVLLNGQSLRANDRFTGELLRDTASAVTTELSTEMGFPNGNGEVVR